MLAALGTLHQVRELVLSTKIWWNDDLRGGMSGGVRWWCFGFGYECIYTNPFRPERRLYDVGMVMVVMIKMYIVMYEVLPLH